MTNSSIKQSRRHFLTAGAAAAVAVPTIASLAQESSGEDEASTIIRPPEGKTILLSCKLGMISKESDGKKLTLTERLSMAGDAGFDGVDLDQAAEFTPAQARQAVQQSGVFVHNAINHAHWGKRLTSANEAERAERRWPCRCG